MQYVFSMTSRMVTIAITSAVLLCVLLFLLGVEIGARMNWPSHSADAVRASTPGVATKDAVAPADSTAAPSGAAIQPSSAGTGDQTETSTSSNL